ncbi:MAG: glycosyltransferase [Syntrophomonas sp.]
MTRRVLIVYEKFGLGHLRMANILKDILLDEDVEVIIAAGTELRGAEDVKFFVSMWNYFLRKNWIRIADFAVNFLAHLIFIPLGEVVSTSKFLNELDHIKPDIIISTADSFNRQLGNYARRNRIPFYIFITEIALFYDLVHPYATHICYFEETAGAVRTYDFHQAYFDENVDGGSPFWERMSFLLKNYSGFLVKGMRKSMYRDAKQYWPELNQAKCLCVGALAEKKHFTHKDMSALQLKYRIKPETDTVLVASGSLGGKLLQDVIEHMQHHCTRPLNLLVMCGYDADLYRKISKKSNGNSHLNVMPFVYTSDFDEFMEIADCVIIRPSAGVFMESLIKKKPVITFKLATTNDRGTLTIINKYQLGKVCRHYRDLSHCLNLILDNKESYIKNIERFLSSYPCDWEEKRTIIKGLILAPANPGTS